MKFAERFQMCETSVQCRDGPKIKEENWRLAKNEIDLFHVCTIANE
jgi:hypothetical protein